MRKQCKRIPRLKSCLLMGPQLERIVLPLHIALVMLENKSFTRDHAESIAKCVNIVFVDSENVDLVSRHAASIAGDVLCAMFKRAGDGFEWFVEDEEFEQLRDGLVKMDQYIRRMTTAQFLITAHTIDRLNSEAKAKGYGFLDKAPVKVKS